MGDYSAEGHGGFYGGGIAIIFLILILLILVSGFHHGPYNA